MPEEEFEKKEIDLSVSMAGLTKSVRQRTARLVTPIGPVSEAHVEVVAQDVTASSAAPPQVLSEEPARPPHRRWYAVTRTAPGVRALRGIHFCEWRLLASSLPGGSLVGSGCHARGFNPEADAVAYWHAEGWVEAPPIHQA